MKTQRKHDNLGAFRSETLENINNVADDTGADQIWDHFRKFHYGLQV